MFKFLTIFFIVFSIFSSRNLFAILEADAEDVELCKKSFLISAETSREDDKSKGMMTLCFKKINPSILCDSEHPSLVFEFFPHNSNELLLCMIHYSGETCCGRGSLSPTIDSTKDTLVKVYKGWKIDLLTDVKQPHPAEYMRYASWSLPNEDLRKAYSLAFNDVQAHASGSARHNSYTRATYVTRIMEKAGLTDTNFGGWRSNSDNLKILVNQYITPRPDRTQYDEITVPMIQ